jgi:hypothetical protein
MKSSCRDSGPVHGRIIYPVQEVCHANHPSRGPILLSSAAVNAAKVIHPKSRLSEAPESFTEKRSWWKSSGVTISVRAILDAGFKRCCMKAGKHDGANRDYFF